ncbi:MAG TPA: aminotransferase class I/II-fold pyridoxal phosphate-dependent enzyme [Bacillota bacterium]|nr:aminotransferase class I/II-fold pyridoxal phosphate-dependent enzyme [Bacillota bacterium]
MLTLPYYLLYQFTALLVGAKIKYYKIDPDNLRLDVDSFRANFSDKTKIVVINSPGNPLGNILTRDELYQIDKIVNGRAVVIYAGTV